VPYLKGALSWQLYIAHLLFNLVEIILQCTLYIVLLLFTTDIQTHPEAIEARGHLRSMQHTPDVGYMPHPQGRKDPNTLSEDAPTLIRGVSKSQQLNSPLLAPRLHPLFDCIEAPTCMLAFCLA
jgi:hypothetical protein